MRSLVLIVAAALSFVTPAEAQQPSPLSGYIGVVSDYVDRGISQSAGHGAVQGGVDWQHSSGAFASLWASSVDYDDDESKAEIGYSLGYERAAGNALFRGSVDYYHYPGVPSEWHYNLLELNAVTEYDFGPVMLATRLVFSPEQSGHAGKATYTGLTLGRPLTDHLMLSFHAGHQWFDREDITGPDFFNWSVTLDGSFGRYYSSLAFSDTSLDEDCIEVCDARFFAGIGITF